MTTTAGINPESVAVALRHLAEPTLHLVSRDMPPPNLPERAAAMLMAQAAGVIERLLEEAAQREAEPDYGPPAGDVRSLRDRLLDEMPHVFTREGLDRSKFHEGHLPSTVAELADALDAAYEPPSGPPSRTNYLRTIIRQAIGILRGMDAPPPPDRQRNATPLTDMSLLALLRDHDKPMPPRALIVDYIERLTRCHDEARNAVDFKRGVVRLTDRDLDAERLKPGGTNLVPIEPGRIFDVTADTVAWLACRLNGAIRAANEAKDLGQKHADERDEARTKIAALQTELAALQDALHREGTIYAAVVHLGAGHRVRRAGWNGKGMWLTMVRPEAWHADMVIKPDGATKLPWVGMRTADGGFVPWLCSQTDLLARDWEVAE